MITTLSKNNLFMLKSQVLEIKEILKVISKHFLNLQKYSCNLIFSIKNNELYIYIDKYLENNFIIKLKCKYKHDDIVFKLNVPTFLNDLIREDLLIDLDIVEILQNFQYNGIMNIIKNCGNSLNLEYNEDLKISLNNNLDLEYNIIYYKDDIKEYQKELINELSLIDYRKLKPKKLYGQTKDTIPAHSLPSLRKEKFNLDKFKEYIYTGILETTYEDLEKNTIEYFYKLERSNFYKEYDIVFKKYSYDEIREIIIKEYNLFSEFYNSFINHELKYNSIENYLKDNFQSLKDRIVKFKSSITDNKLISMIKKYEEEIKIKELETYINSKVNEFTYFQAIFNNYIFTTNCLNKSYLDKFDNNLIKEIIEKIEVNLKNKSLELFKIILSDKKLNSKNFKENYDLNITYTIDKSFIEKIRDRFKQNNITLENIETYNNKIQAYRIH